MKRFMLVYELLSGVCLTGLGVSWVTYGLGEQGNLWWVGVGALVLLGGIGCLSLAYRRLRGPLEKP